MISYTKIETGSGKGALVFLDNKRVGEILPVVGGYQYVTNSGHRGSIFPTIWAVTKSLEILE